MKTYKLIALALLASSFFISDTASAQETPREIGLRASGLDNFNFIYKKQTAENRFLRIRAGSFNFNVNATERNEYVNLGFNVAVGHENRKAIDDRLSFTYGFEPSLSFRYFNNDSFTQPAALNRNQFDAQLFAGYVLGLNLNISDSFGLNLETIPAVSATFSNQGSLNNFGLGLGANINSVALSAVYRFNK